VSGSLDGKIKDDGREEAIRYEALTRFVLKGYYTLVSVFGIDTSTDPRRRSYPKSSYQDGYLVGRSRGLRWIPGSSGAQGWNSCSVVTHLEDKKKSEMKGR
jgi:hypothetical protein